jgi:hypothetical protein
MSATDTDGVLSPHRRYPFCVAIDDFLLEAHQVHCFLLNSHSISPLNRDHPLSDQGAPSPLTVAPSISNVDRDSAYPILASGAILTAFQDGWSPASALN